MARVFTPQRPRSPAADRYGRRDLLSLLWKAAAILATALAYAAAVYGFLTKRLDQAFDRRMRPYDAVAQAQSLERSEQWEEAAIAYRDAVAQLDSTRVSPRLAESVYDGLLHAIVNTAAPERFSPELSALESRVGTRVPATPWRLHELGYYYLRTGDTSKARAYLTRSLQLREARGQRVASGVNERNLATVAVAGGNVAEALAHLRAASEKDPSRFYLPNLTSRAPGADREWVSEMRGLYGTQFEKSWQAVLDSVRVEVNARAGRPGRPPARENLERVGAPHPEVK